MSRVRKGRGSKRSARRRIRSGLRRHGVIPHPAELRRALRARDLQFTNMFSTNRKSVIASSSEGNAENSNGPLMYMTVSRITVASVMLADSRRSIRNGGKGTSMTTIKLSEKIGRIAE